MTADDTRAYVAARLAAAGFTPGKAVRPAGEDE